jgi:hypothetical protein
MNTAGEEKATSRYLFGESLLWIAVFVALALSIAIWVSLVLIDFVHGNPNRSKGNAVMMMALIPVLIGLIAPLGVFIVFSSSQIIQGVMMRVLHPWIGRYAYIFIGLSVPVISMVTWYCYDYLTPSNFNLGINEGADWVQYQHGINLDRYLATLAIQGLVTVFTLLYFEAVTYYRSRKTVIRGALLFVVAVGVLLGYREAVNQIHFISAA